MTFETNQPSPDPPHPFYQHQPTQTQNKADDLKADAVQMCEEVMQGEIGEVTACPPPAPVPWWGFPVVANAPGYAPPWLLPSYLAPYGVWVSWLFFFFFFGGSRLIS